MYSYKEDGRQPIPMQDWDPEDDVPYPLGVGRAAYGALVHHVRANVSINKPSVDPLHQIWYRELMKRAAVFTSRAVVDVINHRQPLELQTRPYVEERVEELVRNFDHTLLGPAVVVVQDVFEESDVWDTQRVAAAVAVKASWEDGRARDLFAAVEDAEGAPSVHAYTLVGNHSTVACSRSGTTFRRPAYVFFRSALQDDDFRFISRTENELSRAGASTTAMYDEYRRPLRLVPFLRSLWERHGRPRLKGGPDQQRYNDYIRNVNIVLEHEPAPSKHGQSVTPWLEDADRLNAAVRLKAVFETRLENAKTMKQGDRETELQAVSR